MKILGESLSNSLKNNLIVLPHLDDEFALIPVIDLLVKQNKDNLSFIYCAERNDKKKFKRRSENLAYLKHLGVEINKVTYLNDFFSVEDLKLYKSSKNILAFIEKYILENEIRNIFSLTLEGGHPDHDALSILINKISKKFSIESFYFPSYTYSENIFLPINFLKPLKINKKSFQEEALNRFCWLNSLKVVFFYPSEFRAMLKIFPFILIKALFSKKIFYTRDIDISSVDWDRSLTVTRYKEKKENILNLS